MLTGKKGKLSPSLISHYLFIAPVYCLKGLTAKELIRNVCSGRNTAAIVLVSDFFNIILKS